MSTSSSKVAPRAYLALHIPQLARPRLSANLGGRVSVSMLLLFFFFSNGLCRHLSVGFAQALGVPKPGCLKPGCLRFRYAEPLFYTLLRPFALSLCSFANLRLRSFALFCAHLHLSASDRI